MNKFAPAAAALTAVIALGSIASPVMAQDYRGYNGAPARYDAYACQDAKHQNQTAGGIIGALAGAVIGSNLAAHGGGRTGGALLGAAAGAAVGSNIGVSSAHQSGACQSADAYGRSAYGYDRGYASSRRYVYGRGYVETRDYGRDHDRRYYRDADYRDYRDYGRGY